MRKWIEAQHDPSLEKVGEGKGEMKAGGEDQPCTNQTAALHPALMLALPGRPRQ